MQENVEKFFQLVKEDPALQRRLEEAEAAYPGSLEIRSAVVEHVLLPVARELGLPFTLLELRVYETGKKARRAQADVDAPLEDPDYWILDRGWDFCPPQEQEDQDGR